ncbi:hypothetical protein DL766_005451 [Monosporascus sp. MC13-8B]|uniref:Homeobox domain-containing protein n=1 Tax=Monosporascus cannonballus TaxID=155416 RepID=A0ABY0H9G0_9PEZI|nr:hypothetical protein DL762_004236 [Monosporascus cannonballus]RYP00624.1 hypothetical protein DL763_000678 [Monosporascus cannonballus]RYP29302.1 hypothetical protein DL766_005451 [Monosporascus sp. MC13-8B]
MPRGTKHLTEADRQRVRTLYFDAKLSPSEIERITGFTLGQIKRSRESVQVGKRTGRPKMNPDEPVEEGREAIRAKISAAQEPLLQPPSTSSALQQPETSPVPLLPNDNPLVCPIDPTKTIVLITGANRGIGLEVVKALLRAEPAADDSTGGGPYHVFLCSRDWAKGEQAAASLVAEHENSLSVLPLDVTSAESVKWAAQTVDSIAGRVDILVNNAAVMRYGGDPIPTLREALETNLVSAFAISEAFKSLLMVQLPSSKKDKRLIHMTCDMGSIAHRSDPSSKTYPITAPEYRISKAGLNMMAACQRFDLQGSGVKVCVYNTGYTATDLAGLDPDMKRAHGAREVREVAEAFIRVVEGRRDEEFGQMLDTLEGTVPW